MHALQDGKLRASLVLWQCPLGINLRTTACRLGFWLLTKSRRNRSGRRAANARVTNDQEQSAPASTLRRIESGAFLIGA
jgi:hypothetical protein